MELIAKAQREIKRSRASLGNMPEVANRMINVLNNRTSAQLATMGISNRTETILLVKRVNTFATNQITERPSTSEETGPATGQSLYNRVENLFFIMNEIKHLFEVSPNFYKYKEADETLDAILRHQLPTQEWWTSMIQKIL